MKRVFVSNTQLRNEDGEDEVASVKVRRKANTFSRLGKCEVCQTVDAIYCCPKCEVKTCCLSCVQIHKKELACDGIRDRTKFIPLRQMTKLDFMSDYYFLEECTRFVAERKGDRNKRYTRYDKVLPKQLFRLRQAAAERGTTLRFLLQHFTRHKANTTYYDWQTRKICWRVEWIFMNAGGLKYVDERCDEDLPLQQLLDKYLNPASVELVPQKKTLEYYQSVGVYGLKILLKAEGIKRNRTRFYFLDASKTLKENLAGKTLVEFPCIYLSYEARPAGCDIIDSDDDIDTETKAYQAALDELHQKNKEQRKLKNDDVNDVNDDNDEDESKVRILQTEKRREERKRRREEFEKKPSNYLFTDEKLWDMLSSSSEEEGNETAEEESKNDDKI